MERRKTPRSLPNRKPYFDHRDIDCLVFNVELHFLTYATGISRFGSEGPPRHVSHFCFFPYAKGAKYPEQVPELMLFMQIIKDLDLDRAKRYLEYLGFDEEFVGNFLEAYRTEIPETKDDEKTLWSDEAFFDVWFSFLYSLKGEELRSILARTTSSEKRWERRLASCKSTWDTLRLSRGAVAAVTAELVKRNFPAYYIDHTSWIKKLQRWEAGRLSLRVVKPPSEME